MSEAQEFQDIVSWHFREHIKWLKGERSSHVCGLSGLRWIIDPYELAKPKHSASPGDKYE